MTQYVRGGAQVKINAIFVRAMLTRWRHAGLFSLRGPLCSGPRPPEAEGGQLGACQLPLRCSCKRRCVANNNPARTQKTEKATHPLCCFLGLVEPHHHKVMAVVVGGSRHYIKPQGRTAGHALHGHALRSMAWGGGTG